MIICYLHLLTTLYKNLNNPLIWTNFISWIRVNASEHGTRNKNVNLLLESWDTRTQQRCRILIFSLKNAGKKQASKHKKLWYVISSICNLFSKPSGSCLWAVLASDTATMRKYGLRPKLAPVKQPGGVIRISLLIGWFIYTQMLHGTGIFTYIYHKFEPNVGKYSRHGAYGI